jgi:hypothetical protein
MVDPEITQLASAAATQLVQLLTTEGWQQVKDRLASLWRRAQPDRADAVAVEIGVTRDDLLAAQQGCDDEAAAELRAEWQGRLRRLLGAHPEAARELRELLAELTPDASAVPSVTQHAVASGNAKVYQAGRDQKVTYR